LGLFHGYAGVGIMPLAPTSGRDGSAELIYAVDKRA